MICLVSRNLLCHDHFIAISCGFPWNGKGELGAFVYSCVPPLQLRPQALVEGPGGRAIIPLQMLTLYPF
jgi:hypothetical protein